MNSIDVNSKYIDKIIFVFDFKFKYLTNFYHMILNCLYNVPLENYNAALHAR